MANVTNAKDAIADFYHRHSHTVRGMKASILALMIELEYNRGAEEDQIKKKLEKHLIEKRLLSTRLAIFLIIKAIDKWMMQLKKLPLILQSATSPSRSNDRGIALRKLSLNSSQSEP